MTTLRYTGQQPTSFMAYPYLGEVALGEFEVRQSDAEVLLRRADVEAVGDGPAQAPPESATEPEQPTPPKPRKASASKSSSADEPAADAAPSGE